MSTLSTYFFQDSDLRSNTSFFHRPHQRIFAKIPFSELQLNGSALVLERPDDEVIIDLFAQVNQQSILDIIDGNLGSQARRTSPIFTGWKPWRYVEYHDQEPDRHNDSDLLVRIFFNVHVSTPWYCSDVDGDIEYYVVPFLDPSGKVKAFIDGSSFHTSYGSICREGVRDQLRTSVPLAIPLLQSLVDASLAGLSDKSFSSIYLLPGAGETQGSGTVNVDERVSIGLIPLTFIEINAIHPQF
jgi:hypothetical protein